MSHIDSEVVSLRLRLAALEEQKRIEEQKESEKKAFPLKTLELIIDSHKGVRPGGSNKFQHERWRNSQEKLSFLEPILNLLKDMQGRLEVLEKKE